MLRPVLGADLERLRLNFDGYEQELRQVREELSASYDAGLAERIEERTAAYISDKADALGLEVKVRVETAPGEAGVSLPVKAEVTGPRSEELASYMENELGIPRERQVWHEREN